MAPTCHISKCPTATAVLHATSAWVSLSRQRKWASQTGLICHVNMWPTVGSVKVGPTCHVNKYGPHIWVPLQRQHIVTSKVVCSTSGTHTYHVMSAILDPTYVIDQGSVINSLYGDIKIDLAEIDRSLFFFTCCAIEVISYWLMLRK